MPETPLKTPTQFTHHRIPAPSPPPKEHEFHGHEVGSWSHRYVSAQAENEKEDF